MYKLVVLLSLAALAAAKPSAVVPLVPASSPVSQYSSSVVHSIPTVYGFSNPGVYGNPAVYGNPGVYGTPAVYSAPAIYGSRVVSPVTFAQAPNSPAVVLDAVNGVPLDTPEVVAARAAHYQAKALSGSHHLRKQSVGVAPVAYSSVVSPYASSLAYHNTVVSPYSTPVVSAYSSPVVSAYSSPVVSAYSSPVVSSYPLSYTGVYPKALSVHPY